MQQAERVVGLDVRYTPPARRSRVAHVRWDLAPIGDLVTEPITRRMSNCGPRGKINTRITAAEESVGKLRRKSCSCSCALYSYCGTPTRRPVDLLRSKVLGSGSTLSTIESQVHGTRAHRRETRRQILLLLQVAAEREHRDVHRERERRAEPHDVLVVTSVGPASGTRVKRAMRQRHHERAHGVARL